MKERKKEKEKEKKREREIEREREQERERESVCVCVREREREREREGGREGERERAKDYRTGIQEESPCCKCIFCLHFKMFMTLPIPPDSICSIYLQYIHLGPAPSPLPSNPGRMAVQAEGDWGH